MLKKDLEKLVEVQKSQLSRQEYTIIRLRREMEQLTYQGYGRVPIALEIDKELSRLKKEELELDDEVAKLRRKLEYVCWFCFKYRKHLKQTIKNKERASVNLANKIYQLQYFRKRFL